jgi:hypothetical protein
MSDNELGLFLRVTREAVTPADVGLPAGTRRRTPGLRRAELATLAGVTSRLRTTEHMTSMAPVQGMFASLRRWERVLLCALGLVDNDRAVNGCG